MSLLSRDTQNTKNITDFLSELDKRFKNNYSTSLSVCEQHGKDEGSISADPPIAVVFAENTQDIQDLVKLADKFIIPVIPFAAGSSLEGQLLAIHGGVSLDLNRMNKIIKINAEDMTVTVQPGVTREQLNEELKSLGLFFPIDPGANASIGGMTSTRASGTNAVRYGTMRENVLMLEVVTASGEVIKTGTRAKKSAAGYDLTRLMVGSEGTLGIFAEITLRIYPLPEAVSAAICTFPSIENAVKSVIEIIQMGVPVARVELLDEATVKVVNDYSKLNLKTAPMLLFEFHGSSDGVEEQAQIVQEITKEWQGQDFEWATTPEERTRLFKARHNSYYAAIQSRPGSRAISTDTCVPISRLADCLLESIDEVNRTSIPYFLVGHVGDGNFHFGYLIDPGNEKERQIAEDLNRKLVKRAISMEGTCTGEHGVGIHKKDFLIEETGDGAIKIMKFIKKALDPKNILNPSKIFDLD